LSENSAPKKKIHQISWFIHALSMALSWFISIPTETCPSPATHASGSGRIDGGQTNQNKTVNDHKGRQSEFCEKGKQHNT
jgi:hypothetical protein